MKKKNLVTMAVTLGLVAAVGIGSTLAYLSDTTGTVTNTFTIGKVDIDLDENGNGEENDDAGFDYKDLVPGASVDKEPFTTVKGGSADSYVFMSVTGVTYDEENNTLKADAVDKDGNIIANDAIVTDAINGAWEHVATTSYGEVFRHSAVVAGNEEDQILDSLFTTVTLSTGLTDEAVIPNIVIKSSAIQSGSLTAVQAFAELYPEPQN